METDEGASSKTSKAKYKVLEMIDYGSFGDIFKIRRTSDNKIYALKQIHFRGNFDDDPYIVGELYSLTHLKHKNIIKLHEVLVKKDEINIIMEYAKNENLHRYLANNDSVQFDLKHKIYCQILEGVRYCHSLDIAHRDLTPMNILLSEDMVVKIADFGLAVKCYSSDGEPLLCKDYLGHSFYLPPEVLAHKPYHPKPTDIWSIAITLLYILFQDVPYKGLQPDILSDQLKHSWKSFMHDKLTHLKMAIKPETLTMLSNSFKLCPDDRCKIEDLVRSWDDIGPEGVEEVHTQS